MIHGEREAAVEEAMRGNYFGLALFIALMCGSETYENVRKQFVDNCFVKGSPLFSIATLSSMSGIEGVDPDLLFGKDENLKYSWKRHLVALISNRVNEWDKAAQLLGDSLSKIKEYPAAHFCYMVSGTAMGKPNKKTTKWSLVGCEIGLLDISLRTNDSLLAFSRTEAYEWAKQRANSKAVIKCLQPFKLVYCHILVDMGLISIAKVYLDELLSFFECSSEITDIMDVPSIPLCYCVYRDDRYGLKQNILALNSRLNGTDRECAFDMSFVTAHSQLDSKNVALKKRDGKEESVGRTEFINEETDHDGVISGLEQMKDLRETFDEQAKGQPRATKTALDEVLPGQLETSRQQSTKSSDSPRPLLSNSKADACMNEAIATPMKVAPSPISAPADLGKHPSTPSSARRVFGMFRSMFAKPDDDKAVHADLGGKLEAYYDQEKKRWIFPDDDPNTVDLASGPPPTTTELEKKGQGPTPTEVQTCDDPLSLMMAPPPSRLPRTTYPTGPDPTKGSAPPKFAVFAPKPN